MALIAIVLWRFAHAPLLATLLVIFADSLAFVPTFRKSLSKPHEETVSQYALSSIHWIFSIAALQVFALTTWLYPAVVVIEDFAFVVMLVVRRKASTRHVKWSVYLSGLDKHVWKDIDTDTYIKKIRKES